MTALALIVSVLTGCALFSPVFPAWRYRPIWLGRIVLTCAGALAGIGIDSVLFFLLLWAGLASPPILWGASIAMLAISAFIAWRFRTSGEPMEMPKTANRHLWWLSLIAVSVLLMVAVSVSRTSSGAPHGDWDAWSMWNLRAKHLAAPDQNWRHAVSTDMALSWPDYPLLLPASVARLWKMSGVVSATGPQSLSLLFTACAVGLLFGLLAMARGWTAAVLAMLPMAACSNFWSQASGQYADIPLSAFMLGSLGLAVLRQDRAALMAAGLLASLAAWTKNEGAVYCLLLLAATFYFRGKDRFMPMLLGAAPVLVVVAAFKLLLAPSSGLLADPISSIPGKLMDLNRWLTIISMTLEEVRHMGIGIGHPLLVLAAIGLALGFTKNAAWRFPATVLMLQMGAYLGVYLITPSDVRWHVGSSFGRLLAQVWPSILLAAFLAMRTMVEVIQTPVPEEKKKKGRHA